MSIASDKVGEVGSSRRDISEDMAMPRLRKEGFEELIIERDDAVEIIERLRETHVDIDGHAFLLKLDTLIVRMGRKWEFKKDLVFEHLNTAFCRAYPEPNWCIPINEDCWLGMIPEAGPRKGALFVSEIWHGVCNFFVGDMSDIEVPIYGVLAEDVDRLAIRPIETRSFFDTEKPVKASGDTRGAISAPDDSQNAQRPAIVAAALVYAGRSLKVATSIEPLFEMKKMVMIGHRLESMVVDSIDNTLLDRKARMNLDWGLREMIDIMNIDQGLKLLKMRSPEQRKMMMVVPAAFSTFASARARQKITADVTRAANEMGLKILFEVRELDGVPPHRVLEIVSMIKPFCMTVVGAVSADRKLISGLNKCGLSGVCIEYDGGRRDEEALRDYLTGLATAAKLSAGACMMHGFETYRQMALARLAGITHASMRTASLMSSKTPSQASDTPAPPS
ncbi:MAG: hypothetical protein WBQ60_02610 [Asticcacaulis sp.]